jgi:FAD/FMN-containing dehydrogenase
MTSMQNDVIDNFRNSLRGRLLRPADPDYDQARTIWNAMIDRRPEFIVRCAGTADVLASLVFARDHGLPLAVRGGGHNIGGSALCDDGLVIDLSGMTSVRIDPRRRRAYVEGGATLRDFDHEAQAFALATPLGINSTTGVAGLTLGGGFGWLTRKFGMTIDNLVGADIVTADGQLRHISETEEPDLFWAIRGGGGNFGVVTVFEFALHPVGPEVTAGLMVFPFAQAKQVLTQYRDMVRAMGEDASALPAAGPARGNHPGTGGVFTGKARGCHAAGRGAARLRPGRWRAHRPGTVHGVAAGVRSAAGPGGTQLLEVP